MTLPVRAVTSARTSYIPSKGGNANGQPLAIGRVMTPTLGMTVQREAAIAAFIPEPFYTVQLCADGIDLGSKRFADRNSAASLLAACKKEDNVLIQSIEQKERTEKAPELYDLTTLQRDANRILGFTAQQTLDYTQSLYEKKLVTYPRTDSRYLTEDAAPVLEQLVPAVTTLFHVSGEVALNTEQVINNKKVSDHHAIIPTKSVSSVNLETLPKGEQEILRLISIRLLAAVSEPYRFVETTVTAECAGEVFTSKGKVVVSEGWKGIVNQFFPEKASPEKTISNTETDAVVPVTSAQIKEGKTTPPKHFTEDLLLQAMETACADEFPEDAERKGIGTPATRAATIEKLVQKGYLERKRTIRQARAVTSVDTASEALAVSIAEHACVDMAYMSQLSGKSVEDLADELRGVIFQLPGVLDEDGSPSYVTADEYLSGNVRQKLAIARRAVEESEAFRDNVEALEKAQPKDLETSEIDVRLGATWIDKKYIQAFMEELLQPPFYLRRSIVVNYSPYTAEWSITGKKNVSYRDVNAYTTYGTSRINAYQLLQDSLNLRDSRVYDTVEDPDGKERRVLNQKETTLAQQKQQAIKDAFRDWIWKDPERRQTLVELYNEKFNSTRPREYDGTHISFSGMSPEISLREHQKNAIAHILYGGNTLLAHEVGSGKTFEMVAAAMESKRLGLCSKSMIVVPNHLIEQWAGEFLRLYPSANLLVARRKDFEPAHRKTFCSKIATGDYDAVIIGHSQFEKIPMSFERQQASIEKQIAEVEEGIAELRASGAERFTVKSMERTKRGLKSRLEKLLSSTKKDDVVTFEQLGVDRLFVDEAHGYKNLFLYTKMQNVAGISTTDAQKSSDMYMKCQYLDEKTGGRGVIFATGTPISNSMTELYTMMRYLQSDTLREKGWSHFDCWAAHFGETKTVIELAPEGTGYRARTRFAKFYNLPELINIWKEAADVKTADQLHLPRPEAVYHNEVAKPTPEQQELVSELSDRAAKVHSGIVEPREDNMLKITSDGRKLGLDQRIINPDLPDEQGTKINMCVENILRIWRDGETEKLTQLVFCDISTPKAKASAKKSVKEPQEESTDTPAFDPLAALNASDSSFTAYDDIRSKLIAGGIPPEQIAFIHDANTETRKKELFAKVRTGQVRVLMGSTFKMGAGMNVQDRLIALHDLDCPWRPGDLEQRSGRIIRQGNMNKQVHIYRYVTEGTFDSYLWQTVENKQKFISQIMTSKSPVRSCEDVDETALSFAEIKALCAGNPAIKEKMDLDIEVARLKVLKADHQSQQFRMEDNLLKYYPEQIRNLQGIIAGLEADIQTAEAYPHPEEGFAGMTLNGKVLSDKEKAGVSLLEASKQATGYDPLQIGSYRGFEMRATLENFGKDRVLTLTGQLSHRVTLGNDARGNLIRIDNAIKDMLRLLSASQGQLQNLQEQAELTKAELGKPFPQEAELAQKSQRLAELNSILDMDGKKNTSERGSEDRDDTDRPSVLDDLHRRVEEIPPYRRTESRELEERAYTTT